MEEQEQPTGELHTCHNCNAPFRAIDANQIYCSEWCLLESFDEKKKSDAN